jgi:hypothetical protein
MRNPHWFLLKTLMRAGRLRLRLMRAIATHRPTSLTGPA